MGPAAHPGNLLIQPARLGSDAVGESDAGRPPVSQLGPPTPECYIPPQTLPLGKDDMRTLSTIKTALAAILAAMLLAGCAMMDLDDPGEFQSLSSEKIPGVKPDDIRIEGLHGFMLNTYWTAVTPKGRYGCMRDLNGEPACEKRR